MATYFKVYTTGPINEGWEERDRLIKAWAGRHSDFCCNLPDNRRVHSWSVRTYEEAKVLYRRLEHVAGITVTMKEEN
jgi:hypothetical protein